MNQKAAEALYAAEAAGVKQIKMLSDEAGGRCAMGVIAEAAVGTPRWDGVHQYIRLHEFAGLSSWPLSDCPCCGASWSEYTMVTHLNDVHDLTFAEIARKLGPDHA